MKCIKNCCVAVASIQFKIAEGYIPRSFTIRKCYISVERNDDTVKREASRDAEEWILSFVQLNPEIRISYTIRIEYNNVSSVVFSEKLVSIP